jgi:ubiquinone/menaquinone biosynthesis C-methylase UbiE
MRFVAKLWWGLVQFGFRLLYNEFAFAYDLVSTVVSLGQWRSWQRTALKHLKVPTNALILELAHGTGNLQIDFHAAGYRTIAYDLSASMGRITQHKLKKHNIVPKLVRGKAQQLPFPSGTFAAVVSTFPTNFIFMPETLGEIHRILQSNGQLIVVPGGSLVGKGLAIRFIEWLYAITGQRDGANLYDPIKRLFAQHGFAVEFVEEELPHSRAWLIIARRQ